MALRWCTVALCAAVVLGATRAHADPRVVIVETSDAPALPGLAAQVQLHAGRAVTVSTLQDKTAASMTYAARASAIVSEQDATIVVWVAAIEADETGQRTFLVYAAGRFPGRALLELVRLDASTPPGDVERTVALKISGLFDTLAAPRPISAVLGIPPTRIAAWRFELSGSIVAEAGDRDLDGRVSADVDRRWSAGDWVIAAGLAGYWQPSSTITALPGFVSIDEVGARVALGIERPFDAVTLFARPNAALSFLFAEGTSTEGAQGSATVPSPSVGADVGARWRMSDTFELTTAVTGEWALTRQEFLVDGQPAADLRHGRVALTLGLSLPLW